MFESLSAPFLKRLGSAAWMVGAALSFSIMSAFVKALHAMPTWEVVFFRSFINVVFFFPWACRNPFWKEFKKEPVFLLLRGFFGWLSLVLYFYSIQRIPLADGAMLTYSSPVAVLFFSWLFLGERLSARALSWIAVAFAGVLLVLKPGFRINNVAGLAGMCSAIAAAIAYVTIKIATRKVSADYIVFTFAVVSTLSSAVPAALAFQLPSAKEWLCLLAVGVAATLGQKAMTRGYAALPISVASPILLSAALFSAFWGWAFWSEIPDALSVIGAAATALGLALAYRHRAR